MNKKIITLRPGKDKSIKAHHPWIFSGAIGSVSDKDNGAIYAVYSADGSFLGQAYYNSQAQITARMLSFDEQPIMKTIYQNVERAIHLRRALFDDMRTNCYRLINAEGDLLPGLIVDKYGKALVVQIGTLGMEKLKSSIIDYLINALKPTWIFEKSQQPSRKEEGLDSIQETLYGTEPLQLEVLEEGIAFIVSPQTGQKTGFFLDQRNMRQVIRGLSKDKRVLNCFSYTGGFSLNALKGGARLCHSVDVSQPALDCISKQIELNKLDPSKHACYSQDVFEFLRQNTLEYDIVILDPPAFAKKQKDVIKGCRGYKDINRVAMQKMPKGSCLLTCSCSHYVNEDLFQKVLFQAALEAKRDVQIVHKHQMAFDHPINIYHPQGDYLKSFLCLIH